MEPGRGGGGPPAFRPRGYFTGEGLRGQNTPFLEITYKFCLVKITLFIKESHLWLIFYMLVLLHCKKECFDSELNGSRMIGPLTINKGH